MTLEDIAELARLTNDLRNKINVTAKLFPTGIPSDDSQFTPKQRKAKKDLDTAAKNLINKATLLGLIKIKHV